MNAPTLDDLAEADVWEAVTLARITRKAAAVIVGPMGTIARTVPPWTATGDRRHGGAVVLVVQPEGTAP